MSREFNPAEQRAIALTLDDLSGWGTLHGTYQRFDTRTGEELPEPVKTVDYYDRDPRAGLPADWIALFINAGWVDLVRTSVGWAWTPTDAGRAVRDAWLPEHLKGRR